MTWNPIRNFLLFCSGADGTILNSKQCEVERNKYCGIGGTILFTAVLAMLSGGYAMFTVFHDPRLAAAFGVLWGLIIFNLDRFIVSSIRKARIEANATAAARRAAKFEEWKKAFPRLLLAVFISIVITKPLELKLFGDAIEDQLTTDVTNGMINAKRDVDQQYSDLRVMETGTERLRQRRIDLENEWSRRITVATNELEGGGGTRNPGDGPEYKRRIAESKESERQFSIFREQYDPIIKANEKAIAERTNAKNETLAEKERKLRNSGLLKKLEALSKLRSHWPIFWASTFIVLLFIALETAPIIVKLFSNRGPYDDCIETIEHNVYVTKREERSNKNDEINTRVALSRQANAERIVAEAPLGMSALQTILPKELKEAQEEVAQRGIYLWKMRQLDYLNVAHAGSQQPASQAAHSQTQGAGAATTPAAIGTQGPTSAPTAAGAPQPTPSAPPATPAMTVAAAAVAAGQQANSASMQGGTPVQVPGLASGNAPPVTVAGQLGQQPPNGNDSSTTSSNSNTTVP